VLVNCTFAADVLLGAAEVCLDKVAWITVELKLSNYLHPQRFLSSSVDSLLIVLALLSPHIIQCSKEFVDHVDGYRIGIGCNLDNNLSPGISYCKSVPGYTWMLALPSIG
jgi:hypothetical protein